MMNVDDPAAPVSTLDAELLDSRFLARGGVVVVRGLLDDEAMEALRREAAERRLDASRSESSGSGSEDWRGGDPGRAYWGVGGGSAQFVRFSDPAAAAVLSEVCGLEIQMTGGGSYSYYSEPGDFLALHRDIVRCDLALLTCVEDTAPEGAGGVLRVYPSYAAHPLSTIRAERHPITSDIRLRAGDSALLLGGIVPHEVTPMVDGQRRTMSVVCFRLRI